MYKMIGIITFNCPHRKTAEIIERCSKKISCICTIPFKERKKRKILINHRPDQLSGPTPQEIGKAYSIKVLPLEFLVNSEYKDVDELIVGGAGILSDSIVKNFKIINSHPGLIPTTRGLDSFKWAIYFQEIMGVTIHQINAEVDLGVHIHHSKTIIYKNDNIADLAERHYRNEVNSLCEYISGTLAIKKICDLECKESRMRMDLDKEAFILEKFNDYKNWSLNR